jgi:hypothetical protein
VRDATASAGAAACFIAATSWATASLVALDCIGDTCVRDTGG